jgi:dienelactone hydrolase
MARNARDIREPEIVAFARALREKHSKLAAVGFCYGGWSVFRLGDKEHQPPLVDCVTAGHPSLLTKGDIDAVGVPVQMLAPEMDPVYTAELKLHTFQTLQISGIPFDYQHFPGVAHACLVRGDENRPGERAAMVRGKDMAVGWMKHFLHE